MYSNKYINLYFIMHRSKTPSDVLVSMKKIVMTCKSITEDVEHHETHNNLPSDKKASLQSLKSPFSNGLAHLVTAAKSHVNGMGLSPVYLLDVAAVNLTSAIINLVKLLGMTTTPSTNTNTTTTYTDIKKELSNGTLSPSFNHHSSHNQQQPSRTYQDLNNNNKSSMKNYNDKNESNVMNTTQLAVSVDTMINIIYVCMYVCCVYVCTIIYNI